MPTGGYQRSTNPPARYCPNPQVMRTSPTSEASEYTPL